MLFTRHNQLIKLTPALIASLFDMTVTALGQSPEYWSGNLQQANEANPVGGFFYVQSCLRAVCGFCC